ncbi:hypothetical protein NKI25_33110 [Mesorhizobium sp. M0808]|uniref:hypothetical protein n=1 Tax=Mesorhizobium sp. M0808 TaxID=2957002 RepID=UPI00333DD5AC
MGVPSRFAIEYPRRALDLIEMLEDRARGRDLLGSFGLLAASAVLTIPYERMKATHFLHDDARDGDLVAAFKRLEKTSFPEAEFWNGERMGPWWQSRVGGPIDHVDQWRDASGHHPMSVAAENSIGDHSAEAVIRVLRNALAHGNIIYLDKDARERADNQMVYMAFLTRYPDKEGEPETYRMVATKEEEFLRFVKLWATWISNIAADSAVVRAA